MTKEYGSQWAYREKATGEFDSSWPYRAKSPATGALMGRLKHALSRYEEGLSGRRWRYPTEREVLAHIAEHYELVEFKLVPVGDLIPTTSEAELSALHKDREKLAKLEVAGVDNWQGYDYAMRGEDTDE